MVNSVDAGTSLLVQWLEHRTSTTGVKGSIDHIDEQVKNLNDYSVEQVFWIRCHVRKQFQSKEVKGIYLHRGNSWFTSCKGSVEEMPKNSLVKPT